MKMDDDENSNGLAQSLLSSLKLNSKQNQGSEKSYTIGSCSDITDFDKQSLHSEHRSQFYRPELNLRDITGTKTPKSTKHRKKTLSFDISSSISDNDTNSLKDQHQHKLEQNWIRLESEKELYDKLEAAGVSSEMYEQYRYHNLYSKFLITYLSQTSQKQSEMGLFLREMKRRSKKPSVKSKPDTTKSKLTMDNIIEQEKTKHIRVKRVRSRDDGSFSSTHSKFIKDKLTALERKESYNNIKMFEEKESDIDTASVPAPYKPPQDLNNILKFYIQRKKIANVDKHLMHKRPRRVTICY